MLQSTHIEADDTKFETFNKYLGAKFLVNDNGKPVPAKVLKRARDNDGEPIGKTHPNPLLDTCAYDCKMHDGTVYRYNANVIAEKVFSQCNNEGWRQVMREITDHRKDNTAVKITNEYTTIQRDSKRIPKTTTLGWQLVCLWRDGSSNWVNHKYLKQFNPIKLSEYAVANRLQEEPAFNWWVSQTLRMPNRIIAKVKGRYWKTS